jgi:hypothetical protein
MGKRNRAKHARIEQRAPVIVPAISNVVHLRPSISRDPELRRSFDAADINPVLNDPSVLPSITVPGIETLDVTALLADPCNVLLATEGGGIIFAQQEPGIYEAHTMFLPAYRGRYAIRFALSACRWMFTHTDCMVLLTRIPSFNLAATQLARLMGATREFDRKAVWPTAAGPVDMAFWALRYDDWVRKSHTLSESGHEFHEKLKAERDRLGSIEPQHADEDCHDRYVGACVETIRGGQPEKAIVLYNRWARFSGYAQISMIARNPLLIDIGDALIQVIGDDFKAIKFKPMVT